MVSLAKAETYQQSHVSAGRPDSELVRVAELFESKTPQDVLRWALNEFDDRIAIATGFGPEGIVLLDMAVRIKPTVKVFFLDTGLLFPETYELRERVEQKYQLKVIEHKSSLSVSAQATQYGDELWKRNPDLCCKLRKLDPLKEALKELDAWITGIRREQSISRKNAAIVERDQRWNLIKVNPLARWTKNDVWKYILKNQLPYNPLHDAGYSSIGCTHCTRAVQEGEDERAGRWSGFAKTECGLHG
ncbi:MAG TPA: phosphoadenylyl-sulfate reductase [Blastocatellia bacterium]|nr:phosphoadenylyl-sulfate reductase [Blastocatellia bacterium]